MKLLKRARRSFPGSIRCVIPSRCLRPNRARPAVPVGGTGAEALEPRALFAVFVVENLNPAGPGSLRQAILDSNATPAVRDEISFDIAGGMGGTIHLDAQSGPLPTVTSPVLIDTTQPDLSIA